MSIVVFERIRRKHKENLEIGVRKRGGFERKPSEKVLLSTGRKKKSSERCKRERSNGESEPDLENRTESEETRASDREGASLRCLTVDEGPTGKETPRGQRQGGPKRYEPRRKPRGKRSANRESRGRLVGARNLEIGRRRAAGKSIRQGKTEPRSWGERKRETGWTQAKAGVKREE